MKVLKTEDYNEDMGPQIFISFGREDDGSIACEPFETMMSYGYSEEDFDESIWTHFFYCESFNYVFNAADPVQFPFDNH